jgi:uncharacterized Fe-S cluster-containing radical SAM superfamily enzyme
MSSIAYNKHNSFVVIHSNKKFDKKNLILKINEIYNAHKLKLTAYEDGIILKVLYDLNLEKDSEVTSKHNFSLTQNVVDEILSLEDTQILRYLFHRYRYEIFPKNKIIDNYPPYLQIEPSSICNYRCVFCFMTDPTFNKKEFGFMGTMTLEMFKRIIDQAENNIEFISLASRGEPLACKDIDKMLERVILQNPLCVGIPIGQMALHRSHTNSQ